MPRTRIRVGTLAWVLMLGASVVTLAQESPIPTISADGTLDTAQVENAINAIEAREDLTEETRTDIIDELRRAEAEILARLSAEADAETFASVFETAPLETARLRAQLDENTGSTIRRESLGVRNGMTLGELEQLLARQAAVAASANTLLNEYESEVSAQQDRPANIRARIGELRDSLDQLSASLNAAPTPGGNALLAAAQRLNTGLRREAHRAELIRLEQELLSYDVRLELLRAERDSAEADATQARQRVELLQSIVNRERRVAARSAQLRAAEAELDAADKHPALREIAEGNLDLTRELPATADEIERATSVLSDVESEIQQLDQAMTRSRQRLDIGGITQATGRLFVDERSNLPRYSDYRTQIRERRQTLSRVGLAQVRVEEERRDLTSLDERLDLVMTQVQADVSDADELATLREEALELLRARRELLAQASSSYRTFVRVLGDLDVAQRRLLETAGEYREFLDQNLIWIPNTEPVSAGTLTRLPEDFAWLVSPSSWSEVAGAIVRSVDRRPIRFALALLLAGGVIAIQPALRRRFRALARRIGRLSTDSIFVTFWSLGIAIVQALPVPLCLGLAGWLLRETPDPTRFTESVTASFLATAPFLYNVLLFRILAAPNGILENHFGWQSRNMDVIRRQLFRIIAIGGPLVFITVMALTSGIQPLNDSLGRLAFVGLMLLLAFISWPLGHPNKSVGAAYYTRNPGSWLSRLRWFWFTLDVGIPASLAVLALIGYLYTAIILVDRFVETIWLILLLVLLSLVIRRWLALERRKIELKLALERREAKRAEKQAQNEPEDVSQDDDGTLPTAQSRPLDLDSIGEQTQKLLQAGMLLIGILGAWGIWADVLPALNILDEIHLWSQTITVDGAETVAPVSLADVLLALVIAFATFVASRNLPGLMEIAVLRHLELQPGSRYTINTLLRYAVVTIGVVSILSIVGWNWSRIQWLVAALSVGLGFGLQEIVANFVSGLIILFERPVRVGDTVTVGQLTGSVSKVRIRATTITDWDRKEIIVPNKSFITEQVVNWTLSDPITRIVVPVGISYGSDIDLATKVMQETLHSMPIVLDEPPPTVYFVGFGDSSLNFNLYVFSRQLADRLPLMHAVHTSILDALRKHDIEIPFPQRDLHVRSVSDDIPGLDRSPPAPAAT